MYVNVREDEETYQRVRIKTRIQGSKISWQHKGVDQYQWIYQIWGDALHGLQDEHLKGLPCSIVQEDAPDVSWSEGISQ